MTPPTALSRTPEPLLQAPTPRGVPGELPSFLEFFAGSGLVSLALGGCFHLAWANDICPKKAAVFKANHPDKPFLQCSIAEVKGAELPNAVLSWASFPCQDLSLAGNAEGIRGKRSGLVWEWLRVMDEMSSKPPVLVAENVMGLVSSQGGRHYRELHAELVSRGYRVGCIVLDALHWTPQSRARVFVVAVDQTVAIPSSLLGDGPGWPHPATLTRVVAGLDGWVWWNLPAPAKRRVRLSDVVDFDQPCNDSATSARNLALIPEEHWKRLQSSGLRVVPGYKRMRNGEQVLELRFDDIAGCLRTPAGGSSRQFLVVRHGDEWRTRILTPREAARLMGAPDSYRLPGTFNDGYKAMGDAVAVPAARHLAVHLLSVLAKGCHAYDA